MKNIKKLLTTSVIALSISALTGCGSTSSTVSDIVAKESGIIQGAKVYAIVNLHADAANNRLHAMNYQLPKLLKICSEFTITDIDQKVIEMSYKGVKYNYLWDKYTRNAGQSLIENFNLFFAKSCNEAKTKVTTLSKIDQKGIKRGKPIVGMSKEGILLAMGRPPVHATGALEDDTWTYWVNRWAKNLLEFNEQGKLIKIIK